jgi:hypothetical protein
VRVARPFVPQFQENGLDELLLAMRDELGAGAPLLVEVDDEQRGDQVRVYLG